MLLTEQQLSRRKSVLFPQPQRILKVRKSMGAIKQVLGERKREYLSQLSVMAKAQEATNAQGATVVESNDSPEPTTLV